MWLHRYSRGKKKLKIVGLTFFETGKVGIIEEIVVSVFALTFICELRCFVAQTSTAVSPSASYPTKAEF